MSVRELIHYSRKLLRGRRAVTTLICLMPLAAEVFFRLAEAFFYSMLLYLGGALPMELFNSTDPLKAAVTGGFTLARWIAAAPLTYISAYRLCELCAESGKPLTPLTDVLTSRRCIRRSLAALLWTKAAALLALAPAAFFGITAWSLFITADSTAGMFMTVHAFALTLVSLGMWVSLRLSLAAAPYIMAEFPEMSAFRAVRTSFRVMRGRKSILLRLILMYLPAMATIAAIPAVLPVIRTSFALCIHIGIKEEEYREGTEIHRNRRKAANAPEFSSRTERRFKAASD